MSTTTTTDSPTFQAMLAKAGYANEEEMHQAAAAAELFERRILDRIIHAFVELRYAETALRNALARCKNEADGQTGRLDTGYQADTTWILQNAQKAAEANSKMQAACEQIQELSWLRTGKTRATA